MKKFLFVLILFATLSAFAGNDGKAKGELQVSGNKIQLQHAYAIEKDGKISVILSDRALEENELENTKSLSEIAEGGDLHAIEVVIRGKEIAEEVFFYDERVPAKLSVKEPGPFTPEKVNDKVISGKLVMNDPGFSFGYKVQFSAPIVKPIEKPEAKLGPNATLEDDAHLALEKMKLDFDEETFTSAVQNGNAEAVKLFLKAGMPPVVHGKSALWTAVEWGHVEVAQVLIDAGLNVNEPGEYGETMLMRSLNGKLAMVETLIKAGADVNKANDYKMAPLAVAAEQGKIDVVQALLKAGANVKARNTYGGTALQVAVLRGYKDLVRILIDAGADVSRDRKELIDLAKQQNNPEIEKMIREAPATPK
ncbi:ankyrin repeat domain-containing protein [bacterium]|nr:ankyrin repeat domain-containing protein [bacterium]